MFLSDARLKNKWKCVGSSFLRGTIIIQRIRETIQFWMLCENPELMRIQNLCLCFYVTCSLVSADVKQASAPVSSRLCDGSNGCCGDAEAGLCEYGVCRCRDIVWPQVIFISCGEAPYSLLLKHWCWGFGDWHPRSEIRFCHVSVFR